MGIEEMVRRADVCAVASMARSLALLASCALRSVATISSSTSVSACSRAEASLSALRICRSRRTRRSASPPSTAPSGTIAASPPYSHQARRPRGMPAVRSTLAGTAARGGDAGRRLLAVGYGALAEGKLDEAGSLLQ